MELPPLPPQRQIPPGAALKSDQAAAALLDISQIPDDKLLRAKVESATLLSPNALKTLQDRLQQLQLQIPNPHPGNAKTPAGESQISPDSTALSARALPQIIHMLSKPQVFALRLHVTNQALLTFSETPYTAKDTLLLRKQGDGLLHIEGKVNSPAQISSEIKAATSLNSAAPLLANQAAKNAYASVNQNSSALEHLTQALKANLPWQKPLVESFRVIDRVIRYLSQSEAAANVPRETNLQQQTQLTRFLAQLKPLLAEAKNAQQLSQPEVLKTQMQHSGSLLEARLRQQLTGPAAESSSGKTPQGSPAENLSKPLDIKAELLRVMQALDSFIQQNTAAPGSAASAAKPDASLDKVLQQLFSGSLFNQPAGKPKLSDSKQLALAIAEKLKPLLNASLARIGTLQTQHLLNSAQDPANPRSGAVFELPVRFGDNLYPLVITIEERLYRDKEQEEEKTARQTEKGALKKRWQVFMEFDLDELGRFASEITVIDQQVKTRLWVQKSALWTESHKHLGDLKSLLENSGLQVEEISCVQGEVAQKSVRLAQSLVDVRT